MNDQICRAHGMIWVSMFLLFITVELVVDCSGRKISRGKLARQRLRKVSVLNCTQFVEAPFTLSADGDFPRFVANGLNLTNDECVRACVRMHPARYCVAANRNPVTGSCLLSGYRLHRNRHSFHFRRICSAGRHCFQEIESWQSRFHTGFIKIPELVSSTGLVLRVADFCRRECEQLQFCIGFDVRRNQNYCPFVEFRPMETSVYDMNRRHCT